MRGLLVSAAVLALIGAGLVLAGITDFTEARTLQNRGERTTGTVLETRKKHVRDGGRFNLPGNVTQARIAFTAGGTRHTFWGTGDAQPGDTVRLVYDPRNPKTATRRPESLTSCLPTVLGGTACLVVASAAVVRARRRGIRPGRHHTR